MVDSTAEETLDLLESGVDLDGIIRKHSLSCEEAIEFYEGIRRDVLDLYGFDDVDVLRELYEESEDLWLLQHIWDLEMYNLLKRRCDDNGLD